ncbi:MAG: AAA family ATPase [Clostridia bacterium]|nr:AAA family ATPase [Clostridia bacterium]
MSDFQRTVHEITACVNSRAPLIVVMTDERDRAESALKVVSANTKIPIEYDTALSGFKRIGSNDEGKKVDDPFLYVSEEIVKRSGAVYAFGDIRGLETDNELVEKAIGVVRLAADCGATLILVTNETIYEGLARLAIFVKLSLPSKKEREGMIRDFIADNQIKTLPPEKVSQAAVVLGGYTALQLKTVMNYALNTGDGFTYENLCVVAMRKDMIFGKNPAVKHIHVRDVHVAGMEGVKEWLLKKQKIFFSPDEELSAKYITPPRGALMVGVPGCGKSLTARLISCEWHLPLYRFDIGAVFSESVGASEANLRRALDYIGSVSPCIVWIDEIEKELAVGRDNEAAQRILGAFLFWLQENADRVFLLATANDLTKLPPELFRKGRFDEVFFVDLPSQYERRCAINMFAKLSLTVHLTDEEIDALAKISEGFSYADIEWAIKTVAEEEFTLGMCGSYTRLDSVFQRTVGILSRNREYIETLRKWGKESAASASGRK